MNVVSRHFAPTALPAARLAAPQAEGGQARAVSLDLTGLLRGLTRRWRWIAGAVIVAALLGVGAALMVKPRYASAVQILVDPREFVVVPSQGGLQQGTSAELAASESETAAGLLRSAGVLGRVVRAEGLDRDPEFVGTAPSTVDPVQRALATLQQRTAVRRSERSFIVEVEVWTREAEKSARLANAIAENYLADRAAARSGLARRAADALDGRLKDLGDRVREADRKVADYKSRNALIGADGSLVSEQQIAEVSKQLVTAQARLLEARKRQEQLDAARRSPAALDSLAEALASPTISALRSRYAEASRQGANLAAHLGPQHPDVVTARAQLADAKSQLDAELSRIVRSAASEADRARASETGLERRLAQLKANAGETGEAVVRLRELERQAEASRTIYSALLNQAKLFTEQQGIDNANARVVSPALPSPRTSGPSRMLLVAGALVAGGVAGLGLALVREITDGTLHEKGDFAAASRLPVLAVLPRQGREARGVPSVDTLDAAGTPLAAVAYRLADHFRAPGGHTRSLMFVSLEPGFTGTRLAFNVATAFAVDDGRVLFADARKGGGLTACLGGEDQPGLSDLLGRRCPLDRAVFLQDEIGVGIVPAGRAAGPGGRPSPARVHETLIAPASRFGHVVIDGGSPLAEVAVAAYAAAVDDVILVVGAGRTRRAALEEAVEVLAGAGANLRGLVLA